MEIIIKIILLLIIPLILFDILMRFEYNSLSKYSMILGFILNPLFKALAEPKIKEVQEKLKERRIKKTLAKKNKKK
jgi:hypothetical protein